ncbi:transmembrane protein, putative (macronuclear) [Tetrahymena thermophila SB210]|uniref:Transmembrane protein, putative n=1 Tax=Tetrahymena thermophila (strain SB210) TaxID=312017 RepID=W7XEP3_TETTS|nr:transmembrane protein, putative [Tetrahymena thermophila SB210]EWS72366.1 transmembrane protein, putative [Tetrahymena thermophila SB210]|eukprot:XP_012655088.1 transmembrane protein, putative [Tetrahymena thermophila SB210]
MSTLIIHSFNVQFAPLFITAAGYIQNLLQIFLELFTIFINLWLIRVSPKIKAFNLQVNLLIYRRTRHHYLTHQFYTQLILYNCINQPFFNLGFFTFLYFIFKIIHYFQKQFISFNCCSHTTKIFYWFLHFHQQFFFTALYFKLLKVDLYLAYIYFSYHSFIQTHLKLAHLKKTFYTKCLCTHLLLVCDCFQQLLPSRHFQEDLKNTILQKQCKLPISSHERTQFYSSLSLQQLHMKQMLKIKLQTQQYELSKEKQQVYETNSWLC